MRPVILCAEDDRNLSLILAKALSAEGYEVAVAHDGEVALQRIVELHPQLLILDLMLPRRDGFALLEAVRGAGGGIAETPAILMSGATRTREYSERARALRAGAFLTKPVPLDTLRDTVAKLLHGGPPVEAATDAPVAAKRPPPPLSGTLEDVPLPALLHHLHGLRADGVLHVSCGSRRKAIELRAGYPVGVRSNLVNECLGNRLVRMGKLSKAELDESVRRVKQGEGLQGQILVAMQRLSEEELAPALRDQAREKLFDLFTWRSGSFRFEINARLDGASRLALDQSPANVILEGVRSRFALERVDGYLIAHGNRYVAGCESPFYRFQEIDLEPDQEQFVASLDGTRTLRDLMGPDERERRLVYGLLVVGLLELHEAPTPNAAPARSAQPARAAAAPRTPRPAAVDPADAALRSELAALAESMRSQSHFDVLGVGRDSSDDDVRNAYTELAKRTHPDRFSQSSEAVRKLAGEVFGRIALAYEVLSDARRRTEYRMDLQRDARIAAELEEGQRALQAELRFQEGEARLKRKDYEGARRCFEQAVKTYPEEGEYHAYLGWALFQARPDDAPAREEALELLREGAKLASDREKPYLFLGLAEKALGRPDVARRLFARAVQIQPECVEALRELRLLHLRQEKKKGLIGRMLRR
jgi:CheY-like chemotaxis protein